MPPMASPKSTPLFKKTASVQCVSSETLMGVWLEASDDRDFAGKFAAPPSDELDGPTRLLGLIYPVEDCLGDGQFDGCPPCSCTV